MENDRYNFGKHYIVLDTKLENHINSKNNPHNVTKADVNLSEVQNRSLDEEVIQDSINYVTSGAVYNTVYTIKDKLEQEISEKAFNADVVHTYGDEIIEGSKKFNSSTIFNNNVTYLSDKDNSTVLWEIEQDHNTLKYTYKDKVEESKNYSYNYLLPVFNKDDISEGKSTLTGNFVVEKSKTTHKWAGSSETEGETKLAQNKHYTQRIGSETNTLYANAHGFKLIKDINKINDQKLEEFNYILPNKTGYFVIDDDDHVGESRQIIYNIKKVTYEELKELRNKNKLIPGQFYQITDFVTTTSLPNTRSAEHNFDIIVQALTENSLNEDVKATYHINEDGKADGYFAVNKIQSYEFLNPNLSAKDIQILFKIRLGDSTSIYWENESKESYKLINEIQWKDIAGDGILRPALINPTSDPSFTCGYVYEGKFNTKKYRNRSVSVLYTLSDSDEILYTKSNRINDNVFVKIDHLERSGVQVPVLYKEDSDILLTDIESFDKNVIYIYVGDYVLDGKTFNRWAKYQKYEDNLVASNLEVLTQIIVKNGDFVITEETMSNSLYLEDMTYDMWIGYDKYGTEDQYRSYFGCLTEELVKINYGLDTKANLSSWEVKYCFDNDISRFAWADESNGKGVIYYMKDEWNNECPYDFKNILFNFENKTEIEDPFDGNYVYTFSFIEEDPTEWLIDASLTGSVHNNLIDSFDKRYLPFNVLYNTWGRVTISNNKIYGKSNILYRESFENTISGNCNLLEEASHNLLNDSSYNELRNECYSNTLNKTYNVAMSSCSSIKTDYSQHINIGDFSNNIDFKTNTCYIDIPANSKNIVFASGCEYIILQKEHPESSEGIQNIKIHSGLKGENETNKKVITLSEQTNYEINIYANGSKDIILD